MVVAGIKSIVEHHDVASGQVNVGERAFLRILLGTRHVSAETDGRARGFAVRGFGHYDGCAVVRYGSLFWHG